MITKVIQVGDKIELVKKASKVEGDGEKRVYKSIVYDVSGEEEVKIAMPQEKGKLLVLSLEAVYKLRFYAQGGVYECCGKVVDRYKTDNIYLVVLEITSALKKVQRREFYRLNCLLESEIHILDEEELAIGELKRILLRHDYNTPSYETGTIVDISGGGARIVTDCDVEEGAYVILKFQVELKECIQEYELLAHVVTKRNLENRKRDYELRVEFEQIENSVRESLIRYIFEEERRIRKSEKS